MPLARPDPHHPPTGSTGNTPHTSPRRRCAANCQLPKSPMSRRNEEPLVGLRLSSGLGNLGRSRSAGLPLPPASFILGNPSAALLVVSISVACIYRLLVITMGIGRIPYSMATNGHPAHREISGGGGGSTGPDHGPGLSGHNEGATKCTGARARPEPRAAKPEPPDHRAREADERRERLAVAVRVRGLSATPQY
jgi:hypothetical protein